MNKRTKLVVIGTIGIAAAVALAAGYDRLQPNVFIGQGAAVTEALTFDTGNGSSDASVKSDGSGNMTLNMGSGVVNGSPTFANTPVAATFTGQAVVNSGLIANNGLSVNGSALLNNGGTFAGTIAGSPTFSGGPVFSGSLGVSGYESISGGGAGGNVPHACLSRNASTVASGESVLCSTGEIALGGGCDGGSISIVLSRPSGTLGSAPTGWSCSFSSSGTVTAWAVCCQY